MTAENEGKQTIDPTTFSVGDWTVVDRPGHLLGGIRADGTVFVNVGLPDLLTIAAEFPRTPDAMVNLVRLAFQAGVNSVTPGEVL